MAGSFATTRWTRVLAARGGGDDGGRAALEELCATYWPALFAWARAKGRSEDDAADLVQGFFERLFARDGLAGVEREGGRFRDWLLAGMRNHATDEHRRGAADKRGGGRLPMSLETSFDWSGEEQRFEPRTSASDDPERAFERRWAQALLERARERIEAERSEDPEFAALAPVLDGEPPDRAALEARGVSAVAIRVRAHRLRERFRSAILDEARATLGPDVDPGDELRALLTSLGDAEGSSPDSR